MISGGNATVFVSNMDRAVRFYTETLGLKLVMRAGNEWAQVDAGKGLMIGLHPASEHQPRPGTPGSIQISLRVDEPLEQVVATLTQRGATFRGPIVNDGFVRIAFLSDPDGSSLSLCEVAMAASGGGPWKK